MPSRTFVDQSQCSRHTIFPGVDVLTAAGEQMMLSLAVFEPEAVVEAHSHPHEQVGMVVEGRARFIVGDEEKILGPGEMYFIPGGVTHRVIALEEGCKALDVFHPVREEYL
ncbi:MAG: cupin domain-containing protein [Planctomycetota bacterium]|nr:MAG: cupin domain-containing protein [Planctomycetota bacterium]REJ89472.1 MAG: cupin domain-containing protein [Planctomycetota bacterium]REK28957.1 MAG: cupin domain-containing protein [Planctomycetota bacterium]REK39609.1 MAG: cupin domain-containing protein [Planctomycetota bacterium]